MYHLINGRLRYIPGMVFHQPQGGDGGGDGGDPQGGTPPAVGTPPASPDPASEADGFQAPWEKSGEEFDADRAKRLLANQAKTLADARKRAEEAEAKAKQYEDSQLSDQQRLEKERDEFKTKGEMSALEAARLRAAIKFGLSEDDLEFIHGSTEEDVLAAAERYAERHKKDPAPTPPPSRRPGVPPRGGSDPSAEPEETDPRKLAEKIPRQ